MDRETIDNYIQQIQINMDQFMSITNQCLHECQITIEMLEQEKMHLENDNQILQDQINDLKRQLQTASSKPQEIEQENSSAEPTF